LGIFISVLIYYIYYLFNLLGKTETIPIYLSTWLPLLLLIILITAGLIRINEK
jgi:lipopolysaccharide export system permease protein